MEDNKFKTLDLINYQIVLEDKGDEPFDLIDIIETKNNLKLSNAELDNDSISRLMIELIGSRMAAEQVVDDLTTESNKLRRDNEELSDQVAYLLEKYNASEEFIEENRGKLEQ